MDPPDELSVRMDRLLGDSGLGDEPDPDCVATLGSSLRMARKTLDVWTDADAKTRAAMDLPDWDRIAGEAEAVLAFGQKRTDAAAALLEALARGHFLPGFIAGTKLVTRLIAEHWDRLVPRPPVQPGDPPPAPRTVAVALLKPFESLTADRLPGILRETILFVTGAGVAYSFSTTEAARKRPAVEARLAALKNVSLDKKNKDWLLHVEHVENELDAPHMQPWGAVCEAVKATQADAMGERLAEIQAAQAAWTELERAVVARQAGGIFPLAKVKDVLTAMLNVVEPLAPEQPLAVASVREAEGPSLPSVASGVQSGTRPSSREQALARLSDVARFFHETEPQSPVAASLDEVVRRARLSWPELMAEMVPKKDERDGMLQRLGIRPLEAPPQ
jgi:type VI secretion system protein ImpA